MEMRQLKIFCAVAEHGSFTAAAEKVHTVQSNVTMRVKELETELGQSLFIRQKSGVVLTSAGQTSWATPSASSSSPRRAATRCLIPQRRQAR